MSGIQCRLFSIAQRFRLMPQKVLLLGLFQTGNERKMPIKKRMGLNSLIILKQIVEKVPERMSESFLKHALSEALRGRYLFEEQLPTRTHDLTKEVKKIYSPFYSLYAIMLIGE